MADGHAAIELTDVHRRFDIARHAVVEASAGTGKTHAMVDIAHRLLAEGHARLEEILMVTFTEKAAGELRDRIRQRLEDEVSRLHERADPEAGDGDLVLDRLLNALDSFDKARIGTIHSFCRSLLREHAFESGQPFATVHEDEASILRMLLRERQRSHWAQQDKSKLKGALAVAGYKGDGDDQWDERVLRVAAQYTPEAGDRLDPEPTPDDHFTFDALGRLAETLRELLQACRAPLGDWDGEAEHPFRHPMARTRTHTNTINSILRNCIQPLHRLCAEANNLTDDQLVARAELLRASWMKNQEDSEHGFHHVHRRLNAPPGAPADVLPQLADLVEQMDRALARRPHQLASNTIHALHDDLDAWLRENAALTHGAMIRFVYKALTSGGDQHGPLLDRIRSRFKYAIVDEFQDTDRLQWEILRMAFAESANHRLFIVGDPKQAIYGFRGADVYTYRDARDYLCGQRGAQKYVLPTNWRSEHALVECCNKLFGEGGWFPNLGGREAALWDDGVNPANAEGRRLRIANDGSGRGPMTFVMLKDQDTVAKLRPMYARFVRDEIRQLRATLRIHEQGRERELRYSDIAILVRKRFEARPLCAALREAGIPYSFYKSAGLWDSEEATHLHYLLAAIAEPDDTALLRAAMLTRFIGMEPTEVPAYASASPDHPLQRPVARWRKLAEQRDWPRLFGSILHDSPVLALDQERASHEWERRLTNYKHLLQILEQDAIRNNLDITGLVAAIAERRAGAAARSDSEADEDLQRIETEADTVRIMTIHAAKGLEFPVVFVAGGFSDSQARGFVRRYAQPGGHWVFDLTCPKTKAQDDGEDEATAEERRLFYVAITRAALKVYVPFFEPAGGNLGGPLCRIVKEAALRAWGGEECLPRVEWRPHSGTREGAAAAAEPPVDVAATPEGGYQLPPKVTSSEFRRLIRVASFSSFHHKVPPRWFEPEARPPDDDQDDALADTSAIPGGTATGTLFHEVFEDLLKSRDLRADLADDRLSARIQQKALRLLPRRWTTPDHLPTLTSLACDLVRGALSARFLDNGTTVAGLVPDSVLAEVEFLYPLDFTPREDAAPVEGISRHGNMLTGVIDAVARVGDRHYVIDWKTNRLDWTAGEWRPYSSESVLAEMDARGYHLQYQIYALALDRWLRLNLGGTYHPDKHLGGVRYVFLRGLAGGNPEQGVFKHDLNAAVLVRFHDEVRERLRGMPTVEDVAGEEVGANGGTD